VLTGAVSFYFLSNAGEEIVPKANHLEKIVNKRLAFRDSMPSIVAAL
jgi:hypothetical protein